jgi:hypothetical protein
VCGRIRRAAAISLLKPRIDLADVDLRSATLRALSQCGYRVLGVDRAYVQLLAIPKDVFLKHWHHTYNPQEFAQLFAHYSVQV